MIKQIPGWANFFILWIPYFVLAAGSNYLVNKLREVRDNRKFAKRVGKEYYTAIHLKWHEHIDWLYCLLISALYLGPYLAKWRFWGDGYHFW